MKKLLSFLSPTMRPLFHKIYDAHILMREDQVMDDIKGVMRLIDEVYQKFGFSYEIELSTRSEHSIGSDEDWELAT